MNEPDSSPISASVHDTAADWLQKRERGVDEATEARFQAWRDAAAANRLAYDRIENEWRVGAGLGNTDLGRDRALVSAPFYLRRTTHLGAAAAASVAFIGVGMTLLPHRWWPTSIVAEAQAQSFETAVGETKTVALIDGSHVTLDTDTRVVVDVSRRRRSAILDRGRARFAVAANAAGPFVVHLKDSAIEADKAVFDATAATGDADGRVRVFSGDVKIDGTIVRLGSGEPTALVTGHQAMGRAVAPPADLRPADSDWTSGMIALDATPIADAITAINRYNRVKVRIEAPAVAGLTISGAFRARDPNGFAEAVAALHGLRIARPAPDLIVLAKRY